MEIKNQTRSENFNLNLILPSNIHIHMTVLAILLFMFCEGAMLTYIFFSCQYESPSVLFVGFLLVHWPAMFTRLVFSVWAALLDG